MTTTTSTTITLIIPYITTSFLNSDPINYLVQFKGFLYLDNLFQSSRKRRQSSNVVIYTTEVVEKSIPYTEDRTIILLDLLPNYQYHVNVSIQTAAYGQTSSVTIVLPTLDATGNMIYIFCVPKNYIYDLLI